jgi:hypothetical protein
VGPGGSRWGPPVGICRKNPPSIQPERPDQVAGTLKLPTLKLTISNEDRRRSKSAAKNSLNNGPGERKVSFHPNSFETNVIFKLQKTLAKITKKSLKLALSHSLKKLALKKRKTEECIKVYRVKNAELENKASKVSHLLKPWMTNLGSLFIDSKREKAEI